jgi:hypothetical protein
VVVLATSEVVVDDSSNVVVLNAGEVVVETSKVLVNEVLDEVFDYIRVVLQASCRWYKPLLWWMQRA